jgi:hypothetical protein
LAEPWLEGPKSLARQRRDFLFHHPSTKVGQSTEEIFSLVWEGANLQDQLTYRYPVDKLPLNRHGLPVIARRTVKQNACYWNGIREIANASEIRGRWLTCPMLVAARTNR